MARRSTCALQQALDTLQPDLFAKLARRDALAQVLEGIDAAGDGGDGEPMIRDDAVGDPCGIAWCTQRLAHPVADSALITRFGFLDVRKQQIDPFA